MQEHFTNRPALGFCCNRLPNDSGWSYTLTSVLGELLIEVERRFGPRNKAWTILGIEFGGPTPSIWYPRNCGNVAIKLSACAAEEPKRAVYQLAHETVHLLHPAGRRRARNLEEGVAECFADEISRRHNLGFWSDVPAYIGPRDAVRSLLDADPEVVRRIRSEEPDFNRITVDLLVKHAPDIDRATAEMLCREFDRAAGAVDS